MYTFLRDETLANFLKRLAGAGDLSVAWFRRQQEY